MTLDLHGATIAEALRLADSVVLEAAHRGRSTVRLVHGTSTTDAGARRTIKTALLDALEDGDFDDHTTSDVSMESVLILGLSPGTSPVRNRLRLSDL